MRIFRRVTFRLLWRLMKGILRRRLFVVLLVALVGLSAGFGLNLILQARWNETYRKAPGTAATGTVAEHKSAMPVPQVESGIQAPEAGEELGALDTEAEPEAAHQPSPERMIPPVAGEVTLAPGWRKHPKFGDWRYDPAIQILTGPGESVRAALSGRVSSVVGSPQEGIRVRIDHGEGLETAYGGLSEVSVSEGQEVKQGEVIGKAGGSGLSKGHVSFEVRKGDRPEDPRIYLNMKEM